MKADTWSPDKLTRTQRALVRYLAALVVGPLVLATLVAGGWGLTGLGGYVVLVFAIVCWDFAALWRVIANRWDGLRDMLLSPRKLVYIAVFAFVFIVWGPMVLDLWAEGRSIYALAYAAATAVAANLLLLNPEVRRLRTALILVYNVLGTVAVGAWGVADLGANPGGVPATFAQGWGIMQTMAFFWGAYFAPIFFLPPILVMEPRVLEDEEAIAAASGEGEGPMPVRRRGPLRRLSSLGLDTVLGGFVVLLLVLTAIGGANVASWGDLPETEDQEYTPREGFEFAAVGRAFTDRRDPAGSWEDVVTEEIERAQELGLDLIRYDLHKELIDDESHMAKLDFAVGRIRAAGMDVMLSPFGSSRWEADHPSFETLVEEISRETVVLVRRYEPAWVLPLFEPNGQVAVNLGGMRPAKDWVDPVDAIGRQVREESNRTRVLIEVAIEPEQGLELVEALSEPGLAIDAIGIDPYPLSADDLDALEDYRARATNPELGFWISEFGVETVLSGQEAQARALAQVVSQATGELNCSGLCVWSLLDDTVMASNLGLVSRDGSPKLAYNVLKEAIVQVRPEVGP